MGNLFLREKESWFIWLFWGLIGSLASGYILSLTDEIKFSLLVASLVLVFISMWMSYSRRFEFSRALKVLFFVGFLTLLPSMIDIALPFKEISKAILKASFLYAGCLLLCVVCALYAKRPKQYY